MRIKKGLSIIMILAMCVGGVGCSSDGDKGAKEPEKTETVTLNVYSDLGSYSGEQEGWFADVMLEKFNVKLNYIWQVDEQVENQYDGNYDIIISGACNGPVYAEALEKGCFLNVSSCNMEKNMPYVSKNLKDYYVCGEDDKHIYGIYAYTASKEDYEAPFYLWNLRYDYYEELGKPEINDLDDWVSVLAQMKDKHKTYGEAKEVFGLQCYDDIHYQISGFVSGYYGCQPTLMGFYDTKNDQYHGLLSVKEDGSYGPYLEMLKLYNELYRKELIDVDSMLLVEEDIANGKYLSSLYGSDDINENMYPVIPKEATPIAYKLATGKNRCISIDSQTKYKELCMKIVDYLYSPEGMLTSIYGPKDKCWYYDEKGNTCLTELGMDCQLDGSSTKIGTSTFKDGYPKYNVMPYQIMATNTDNGEPYNYIYWKNVEMEPANETEASWREWTGANSVEQYIYDLESLIVSPEDINYPVYDELSADDAKDYDKVMDIIKSKAWEAVKAATDAEFDAIVKDMIDSAVLAGYEDLVKLDTP